jgi:hypothetical protein
MSHTVLGDLNECDLDRVCQYAVDGYGGIRRWSYNLLVWRNEPGESADDEHVDCSQFIPSSRILAVVPSTPAHMAEQSQ